MNKSTFVTWVCTLFCAATASLASASALENCVSAANVFLDSLDKDQRAAAAWPFPDARKTWSYFPNVPELAVRKEGLIFNKMSNQQRVLAHRLISCGLSDQGFQKATGIIRLDDILGQTDLYRPRTPDEISPVGSAFYFLAVFGTPSTKEPWGWQLEGHHLGMNFTAANSEIVYAPAFMGADPAEVPDGPYAGWRLLGDEADKALTLINALDDEQRQTAIVAAELPERIFTGPGRGDSLQEFIGLSAGDMTAAQRALLWNLIDAYVQNASTPIATKHVAAIKADFPDNIWLAWMGPTRSDGGMYYRIHSPSLLIEFVTARDRQAEGRPPNPNHVHTMFRYPGNDFGDDLLREHYEKSPAHQHD